jgi:hypothetical protein
MLEHLALPSQLRRGMKIQLQLPILLLLLQLL